MAFTTQSAALCLFFLTATVATPFSAKLSHAADAGNRQTQTTTEFSYLTGPGDTRDIARALALYGAKHKAVIWLARQLAGKGLLKDYADRQMEIFCLVADELQYTVISESFSKKKGVYAVTVNCRGSLADFVKAEIKDAALEKEEMEFSWQEQMEPVISAVPDPGQELSRAYRYIRNRHWRKAVIYLDQLEKKYPNWGDLFFAKALGFEGMHETQQARRALNNACVQGNQKACDKMRTAESGN